MADHHAPTLPAPTTSATAGVSPGPWRSRRCRGARTLLAGALVAALHACGAADPAPASGDADTPEQAVASSAPGEGAYAPSPEDREAIVGAVQAVFDALETGDGELLRSVLAPDVVMHWAESRDGETVFATADVDALVARVEGRTGVLERMWEPRVRVEGALATLWAPYDFYAGDELSHCGIDAATLLRNQDGWRIVALSWTREQPPECELHPEGPPRQ